MASPLARFDSSKNSKRAAQHRGGVGEFAGLNGGTDAAATDTLSFVEDGGGVIEGDGRLFAPVGQHRDISRALVPEAPVGADRDGLQGGESKGEFLEKGGG